ncbi:MAG: protein kinase, partial [Isosphaeraceae bacterium]
MANPAADDLTGRILGDFEILRPIGRGGMGVVYEARQVSLNRTVALKVLGGGFGLTHRAVARFRREAEAAARLHHTNIVPVYATGEDHGAHFYAMELIAGPSLDRVLDRMREGRAGSGEAGSDGDPPSPAEPLPGWVSETIDYRPGTIPRTPARPVPAEGSSLDAAGDYFDRVAAMVAEVAEALDYAHRNGVIHRDIKPSNLLLSPDGRLSVNDFGLARMLEEPGMTMTGEFVGTPKYMSPEQITAGRAPLNHRTDVYSLGATLYELLTLCPPYSGSRRDEVIGQIIHKEPTPPRRLDRRIPVDLETICLKAMDKDPDRRYQTAGAMAEDLRRYVNRYAIAARRAGPLTRAKKWVRRNPALAAALGCVLLAIAAAGGFALQAQRERERRIIEKMIADRKAEANADQHRLEQIQQLVSQTYAFALDGRFDEAEASIEKAELLRASTGMVRLLNGMVTYHRGDFSGALNHLEQAIVLLQRTPDVEWLMRARSLRACVKALDRRFEEFFEETDRLLGQSNPTPDDDFYVGLAVEFSDPQRGFDLMEEFIQGHKGDLVARRAEAARWYFLAIDTGRTSDIEKSLDLFEGVGQFLPKSPITIALRASAHIRAAMIYRDQDRPDWAGELDQAVSYLEGMKVESPDRNWIYYWRSMCFELLDDPDKAIATLKEGHEQLPDDRTLNLLYAMALYRRGDLEEALETLEGAAEANPSLWLDLPRALL